MVGDAPLVTTGFDKVVDAFFRTIPDSGRSGASLSIWLGGAPIVEVWGGVADERTGRPFDADTLSCAFSCTKGVASVLIGMLMERGVMPPLDTPVVELWPQFGVHGKDRLTIGDALAHRGGLSAPRRDLTLDEASSDLLTADVLAAQAPLWPPGQHHQYHTLTHGALTAKLVMLATGRPIGRCLADDIAVPLHADFWLGLPESEDARITYLLDDPTPPPPKAGDPESIHWVERAASVFPLSPDAGFNDPRFRRAGLAGAGGMATASGLARIWSATVATTNGVRLLTDASVETLRRPRSVGPPRFADGPGPYQSWGAGVMVPSDWQRYLSPTSFGHDGAGGQVAFADPDAKIGFAYLTNQMGGGERGTSIIRALARALG